MNKIVYLNGDVTEPQTKNKCIIAHIVNDIGKWGSGVVVAISNKWPQMREFYLEEHRSNGLSLGSYQFSMVEDGIFVLNMVAQSGIKTRYNKVPLRMNALRECLFNLRSLADLNGCEVHMPKIGSDRAGGKWEDIEVMIEEELCKHGIRVFVYNYEGTKK